MIALWIFIGIAGMGLIWGILLQLPKTRGWAFEKTVAMALNRLPKKDYTVINNLFFRTGKSTCQIDHLVISKYGIFVIEAKNYLGFISGRGSDKMLSRRVLGMHYRTRNPIDQNDWHVRYLLEHFPEIKENKDSLIPMVVFNFSSFTDIKNPPCPVCSIQNLLKTIRAYKRILLNQATVNKIYKEIQIQNRNK